MPARVPRGGTSMRRRGMTLARSEGLAVAGLRLFAAGAFSSHAERPCAADASALATLGTATLAAGFQVRADNPLVGLDGRAALLRRLGEVAAATPCGVRDAGATRPPLRLPRRPRARPRRRRRIPPRDAIARARARLAASPRARRRAARRLLAASGGAHARSDRSDQRVRSVPQAHAMARLFAARASGGSGARGDGSRRAHGLARVPQWRVDARSRPHRSEAGRLSAPDARGRRRSDRRMARADGDRARSRRRGGAPGASRHAPRRFRSRACSKAARGRPAGASPRNAAPAAAPRWRSTATARYSERSPNPTKRDLPCRTRSPSSVIR